MYKKCVKNYLHAGCECPVHFGFDMNNLAHTGERHKTVIMSINLHYYLHTYSFRKRCKSQLDCDACYPMVCSKWISSTEAVTQEHPACLSAVGKERNYRNLWIDYNNVLKQIHYMLMPYIFKINKVLLFVYRLKQIHWTMLHSRLSIVICHSMHVTQLAMMDIHI